MLTLRLDESAMLLGPHKIDCMGSSDAIGFYLEANPVMLAKLAQARSFDRGNVDENVRTRPIGFDEAVSFIMVEEDDLAVFHCQKSCKVRGAPEPRNSSAPMGSATSARNQNRL